jgi:predicted site-specific integrase-resolvase
MLMIKPTHQLAVGHTEYPPLLTLAQAVEATGLGRKYIQKLRRSGVVKVYEYTSGGRFRYNRDDLYRHAGL